MIWHDLRDPNDPESDVLAERFHLHPLHVEDCRVEGDATQTGVPKDVKLNWTDIPIAATCEDKGRPDGGSGGAQDFPTHT